MFNHLIIDLISLSEKDWTVELLVLTGVVLLICAFIPKWWLLSGSAAMFALAFLYLLYNKIIRLRKAQRVHSERQQKRNASHLTRLK